MKKTERTRINKYYAKRLTRRYKAQKHAQNLFKGIVKGILIATIFITPMAIVQVSSEAIQLTWGFPEAEAREIGILEARLGVIEEIQRIATETNFKYTDYLIRLACCESKLGTYKENTRNNHPATSVDRGPLMINSYWQKQVTDDCAYDLECSVRWTMDKINKGQQELWVCNDHIRGVKDYTLTHCGI